MRNIIAAFAAALVLFAPACQSGPTTPTYNPPKPPVIEAFTTTPATIAGPTRVKIFVWLSRVNKSSLTMRIKENDETILYHTSTVDFGLAYQLTWAELDGKPSVAIEFSRGIEATTTYSLTASSPAGDVAQTRTVTLQ
jgi:hypothetical protein